VIGNLTLWQATEVKAQPTGVKSCAMAPYFYPYEVRVDNLCRASNGRCTGRCERIVATHCGCIPTDAATMRCREYDTKQLPFIQWSQCVGTPPCGGRERCGTIWNPGGIASEPVDVRWCDWWTDISC